MRELVEREMKDWLKQMIEEVNMIDRFYLEKLDEYKQEFQDLKTKYKCKGVKSTAIKLSTN